MKKKLKILIILVPCILLIGCGKKENIYDFIISEINANEYIKCDYGEQ